MCNHRAAFRGGWGKSGPRSETPTPRPSGGTWEMKERGGANPQLIKLIAICRHCLFLIQDDDLLDLFHIYLCPSGEKPIENWTDPVSTTLKWTNLIFFYSQWSPLVTALDFLLRWGATLDTLHRPVLSRDALQCSTKLLPKPDSIRSLFQQAKP